MQAVHLSHPMISADNSRHATAGSQDWEKAGYTKWVGELSFRRLQSFLLFTGISTIPTTFCWEAVQRLWHLHRTPQLLSADYLPIHADLCYPTVPGKINTLIKIVIKMLICYLSKTWSRFKNDLQCLMCNVMPTLSSSDLASCDIEWKHHFKRDG